MSDERGTVVIHWRDCACEWITKTCDELHIRSAEVKRDDLNSLIARATR